MGKKHKRKANDVMPAPNRAVEQTLSAVLYELLQERSIEDIAVKEILSKSGVSRKTFYKYYSDKYELAEKIWRDIFLSCWYEDDKPLTLRGFLTKYHTEKRNHVEFFQHVLTYKGQNNLWEVACDSFSEALLDLVERCGFVVDSNDGLRGFIELYAVGLGGVSYLEHKRTTMVEHRDVRTPEERAEEELSFIPERLQPFLMGDPKY